MPYQQFHILISVVIGCILDLLIGDPEQLPHPVRAIGHLISFWEKRLCKPQTGAGRQRMAGVLLVVLVLLPCGVLPWAVLRFLYFLHPLAGLAAESILCAQLLAARSLRDAAMQVYEPLRRGDVETARSAVSRIVGRDTSVLNQDGITRAAVETVAENTSDGVTAPLFYLVLGGPVAGMLYKAVNTMDSMIGYRNDRYRYFGTCAARLDDVLNYLPSRLTGLLMAPAAALCGLDGKNALRIFRRDRKKHESPNSAQTESACAGALHVQLNGDAVYFGKVVHKPTLGDPDRRIETEDIRHAIRLMGGSVFLSLVLFAGVRLLLQLIRI